MPEDDGLLRPRRRGIEGSTSKYHGRRRSFLPLSPPAPWNARDESGWVTSASAASLPHLNAACCAAVRRMRFALMVGDASALAGVQLRHHARHRYAAAARSRPAIRRHDGPSAEPARAIDRRAARVAAGYGILQPRVAHQSAQRRPLAVRPLVRRRGRHRPLHARGLRCLSGPVRRGLLHRQGHLRRRCLRGQRSRAASRKTAS